MFNFKKFHNDESGITALETAIILIAFIVVASVFAFTILSAGTASTERGQEAIYSGLENVQSSMEVKGTVIAKEDTAGTALGDVVFTLALASGGEPIDLAAATSSVIVSYQDADEFVNAVAYTVAWPVGDGDELLEDGELAEMTVALEGNVASAPAAGQAFTLEVKPPTGAVINLNRTAPAAIEAVMELR